MTWTSKIVGHEKMRVDQLVANPFNFRRHSTLQRDALRAAIAEVGFIRSVTVNQTTARLLDGHERVWAAMDANQELIDVEIVRLTEAEEKIALATLDAICSLGTNDKDLLESLLGDVQVSSPALQELLSQTVAGAQDFQGESDEKPNWKQMLLDLWDLTLRANWNKQDDNWREAAQNLRDQHLAVL